MGVICRKLETYEYTQYLGANSEAFNDENEFLSAQKFYFLKKNPRYIFYELL